VPKGGEQSLVLQMFLHVNRWRLHQVLQRASAPPQRTHLDFALLCDILACAGRASEYNPAPMLMTPADFQGTLSPLSPAQIRACVTKLTGFRKGLCPFIQLLDQRVVCLHFKCIRLTLSGQGRT
jgi:hypothetical protein